MLTCAKKKIQFFPQHEKEKEKYKTWRIENHIFIYGKYKTKNHIKIALYERYKYAIKKS